MSETETMVPSSAIHRCTVVGARPLIMSQSWWRLRRYSFFAVSRLLRPSASFLRFISRPLRRQRREQADDSFPGLEGRALPLGRELVEAARSPTALGHWLALVAPDETLVLHGSERRVDRALAEHHGALRALLHALDELEPVALAVHECLQECSA